MHHSFLQIILSLIAAQELHRLSLMVYLNEMCSNISSRKRKIFTFLSVFYLQILSTLFRALRVGERDGSTEAIVEPNGFMNAR